MTRWKTNGSDVSSLLFEGNIKGNTDFKSLVQFLSTELLCHLTNFANFSKGKKTLFSPFFFRAYRERYDTEQLYGIIQQGI